MARYGRLRIQPRGYHCIESAACRPAHRAINGGMRPHDDQGFSLAQPLGRILLTTTLRYGLAVTRLNWIHRLVAVFVALELVPAVALAQPSAPAPAPAPSTTAPPPSAPVAADNVAPADPSGAATAPAGADEVLLRNGGMLRGDVVELIPDDHVTVLVAGERRVIPWAEVETVNRGKYGASPSPAPAPSPVVAPAATPPADAPAMGKPRVHLEVRRNRSIEMQRIVGGLYASGYGVSMSGVSWETVCASPCDQVVDASSGVPFVLGNSPITFSKKFKLNDRSGDVHIDVKPGSAGLMVGGVLAAGFGGGFAVGGPMLWALSDENDSFRRSGIILTAVGVPLLAAGIVMLVLGRTRFKIRD